MTKEPTTEAPATLSRRTLLARLLAAGPVAFAVAACTGRDAATRSDSATTSAADASSISPSTSSPSAGAVGEVDPSTAPLAGAPRVPTPACGDDDEPTPEQTEGPYFKADSPERADLRAAGMAGTPLVVTGRVLDTDCRPIAKAILDFWHCDDAGQYDNTGFTLRGHQFADADGRWRLATIVPGVYPGRTRHIHVRVQAPDGPLLTTQLYFPDEPGNASDGIFDAALLMDIGSGATGRTGVFDFVVNV
ncbi:MAG: dioxygenase [Anaerolineae bacterium]